jgi:hypothetical protein
MSQPMKRYHTYFDKGNGSLVECTDAKCIDGSTHYVRNADVEAVEAECNVALEQLDQIDYICSAGDIPEQRVISRQGEPDLDFIPTVERVKQLKDALAAKEARVKDLEALLPAKDVCAYKGPMRDCPTHGETPRLKAVEAELARCREALESVKQIGYCPDGSRRSVLAGREAWSAVEIAQAALQPSRGEQG